METSGNSCSSTQSEAVTINRYENGFSIESYKNGRRVRMVANTLAEALELSRKIME